MSISMQLAIAIFSIILAWLLSAAEVALSGFSKSRAEALVEEERKGAKRLLEITQDPAPYLNTIILLRVVFEVVPIVFVCQIITRFFEAEWAQLLYPCLIMVAVTFIVLGVSPRTLGRQHATTIALKASGPISVLEMILGPIPQLLIFIGNIVTPGKGYSDGPFATEAELRELVDFAEASDVIEADERKMIHSVFELGDTIVREVMVPRTEMVYIESSKTIRQGVSLALRSGYSRIPVIDKDVDDVVGIMYLKDCMRRVYDCPQAQSEETVASLMRKAAFCPDSKPIDVLLREMQKTRNHVVIVIDEFGGTAGLATIEDILEEIVGEIVDEYDSEIPPVTKLGPGSYRISARLHIDDFAELYGLKVEDEDVDTVLGLMAQELNNVPIPGAKINWQGIEIVAERGLGRRHQILTLLARDTKAQSVEEYEQAVVDLAEVAK